jgi:Domain of unknown function (DUF1707)
MTKTTTKATRPILATSTTSDKAGRFMDDRMRVSDADRERVTARLREHFAEGRLSSEELDERVSAALSAKTFGDLRSVMTDLPEPAPEVSQMPQSAPWVARRGGIAWRGPRILPLAIVVLIAAVVIPGAGWLFFAFLKVVLVLWLVACLVGVFAAARFRRRVRGYWRPGDGQRGHQGEWGQWGHSRRHHDHWSR